MTQEAENPRQIVERALLEAGISPVAVGGLLGRIQAESGFNPGAFNPNDPNGGSSGIFQWNGERLDNLRSYVASRTQDPTRRRAIASGSQMPTVEEQARFLAAEVHGEIGTEGGYGRQLLAATTPEEAAVAAISLARPQGWTRSNPSGGLGWDTTLEVTRSYLEGGLDSILGPTSRSESGRSETGADIPRGSPRSPQTNRGASGGTGEAESESEATPADTFLNAVLQGLIDMGPVMEELRQDPPTPQTSPSSALTRSSSVTAFLRGLSNVGGVSSIRRD